MAAQDRRVQSRSTCRLGSSSRTPPAVMVQGAASRRHRSAVPGRVVREPSAGVRVEDPQKLVRQILPSISPKLVAVAVPALLAGPVATATIPALGGWQLVGSRSRPRGAAPEGNRAAEMADRSGRAAMVGRAERSSMLRSMVWAAVVADRDRPVEAAVRTAQWASPPQAAVVADRATCRWTLALWSRSEVRDTGHNATDRSTWSECDLLAGLEHRSRCRDERNRIGRVCG